MCHNCTITKTVLSNSIFAFSLSTSTSLQNLFWASWGKQSNCFMNSHSRVQWRYSSGHVHECGPSLETFLHPYSIKYYSFTLVHSFWSAYIFIFCRVCRVFTLNPLWKTWSTGPLEAGPLEAGSSCSSIVLHDWFCRHCQEHTPLSQLILALCLPCQSIWNSFVRKIAFPLIQLHSISSSVFRPKVYIPLL